MKHLSREDFNKHVGSEFQVSLNPDTRFSAKLDKVTDLRTGPQTENYAISLLAQSDAPLEQMIYTVEHPEMGKLELFLVPVSKDEKGVRYESVFNYLLDP